ncbi:MAG: polyphosphate kinase 1 [Clostridiales bacterium]|nr:polyphosphate kinase 1 [Clostridiales bacterium]
MNTNEEHSHHTHSHKNDVFINRELSWLKFNERVLEEARNENVPLCERLTFLSIFQSNLDEFFMVRVGSLEDQKLLSDPPRDNKTNMTPQEQIDAVLHEVNRLNHIKDETYASTMKQVSENGVRLVGFKELNKKQCDYFEKYFLKEMIPLLSVMIVGRKQPFPFLKGLEIYALAILSSKGKKEKIGIIPCYSDMMPRLIQIPDEEGSFILSEELILHFMPKAFKGYKIKEKSVLRITRNADIDVSKVYDEDLNYRDQMEQVVKLRKKLAPVRMELTRDISPEMIEKLCKYCSLEKEHVFHSDAPLDMSFLFEFEDILRKDPSLVFPKRVPQQTPQLNRNEPIIPQIVDHDVLLSYPYESINPFLNMLTEAARDPKVISIRMTLYRLAKNSKVVEALAEASENGKQVDVLVELKARFDEANNIRWSRRLEDAGCHVVYGIDGLKVHSKLCLITRKIENEIQYITQVGTGNYNEKTARLYTDLSLITANPKIGKEALEVFQAILLGNTVDETECLLVAPKCLQTPILEMIDDEIKHAIEGRPAYIGVKINSLTDRKIITKLVEASKAGVKVDMIVRGISCLQSGIPDKTDNIRIISIVGRYLEHSRIYIFGTPERDSIYIASADFMTRNTLRRVEVAAPIYDETLKDRIRYMFNTMLSDNVKARVQQPDGTYIIPPSENPPLNSQEKFFDDAYEAARN